MGFHMVFLQNVNCSSEILRIARDKTEPHRQRKRVCSLFLQCTPPIEVPVYKIHPYFAICAVDFVNYSCLIWV